MAEVVWALSTASTTAKKAAARAVREGLDRGAAIGCRPL
jgi:hypothetical protein